MHTIRLYISLLLLFPCLLWADSSSKLFRLQSPDSTGITFFNRLVETEEFNYARQFFVYLGGGVAVGDVNGDGLSDLFFTGMQVPNALYLNKGNWKFENVSKSAGFPDTAAICFTPSFIDIDGDNDLDLYVCRFNEPNHLYINDGTGKFTEKAKEFGLAFEGKSVQAVFFDYDHDNDLDCYIAQNGFTAGGYAQIDGYSDKLFRNDAGTFIDVSKQAGIEDDRYALSVSLGDVNNDGWTDIFVANDFEARDLLYVNNKNGTFTDIAPSKLRHTSHFSMGSDIADINNDGWMDILSVDMMPHDHERRMTQMTTPKVFSPYFDSTSMIRNVLQLNCGDLNFCDIGYLAGVAETDWSWSSWIADLDNDGFQDICIVNGINRDAIDMDVASYAVKKKTDKFMWLLNGMAKTRLRNYMFRNTGNLQFEDISDTWGFSEKLSTNGAIYADLDNDGDLDVVLNNIDSTMAVYRNYSSEQKKGSFIKIALNGPGKNTKGLGTKIHVITKNAKGKEEHHFKEMHVNRGFLSCTEPVLHIGLGSAVSIKEINVYWPGNIKQQIKKANINSLLTIEYASGKETPQVTQATTLFTPLSPEKSLDY
ncbi:MAG: CRTAC1 family protein, partial [bacterium]